MRSGAAGAAAVLRDTKTLAATLELLKRPASGSLYTQARSSAILRCLTSHFLISNCL